MNTLRYMDCVKGLTFLCLLITGTATMAAEKITYHHFDALGSPVAATNEQGNVIWRETYQPYGERIQKSPAAATNTRWHTGHVLDPETGLQYAGARYYDPVIGRFMAVDPQDYQEGQRHTYNRYAYGANNPYKYVDPDGRAVSGFAWAFGVGVTLYDMSKPVPLDVHGDAPLVSISYPMGPLGGIGGGAKVGTSVVTEGGDTVIGRVKDLQNLKQGERSLLDRLPDQGSPKANWTRNSGVLRQEMDKGQPIRDASPGNTAGQFLNAERNLLKDRGWSFDPRTNYWMPPKNDEGGEHHGYLGSFVFQL